MTIIFKIKGFSDFWRFLQRTLQESIATKWMEIDQDSLQTGIVRLLRVS